MRHVTLEEPVAAVIKSVTAAALRTVVALACVASVACGGPRIRSTDTAGARTLAHGGRTRSYVLRVPPTMPAGKVALVLVLHGGGGNGLNAESMSGFTPLATSKGFIVAYPDGTARGRGGLLTWNAGHCCGYAMQNDVDDVGFIGALIDDLVDRYPIDPQRVYVTGMSNGAMMTHRIGRELSERVAAIAPVAGDVFGDERVPPNGVSAIMINGMKDQSIPHAGGAPGGRFTGAWDGTPLRPVQEQAEFWARADGCSDPATVNTESWMHVGYKCPAGLGVEWYALRNNGHAWPGGKSGSRLGDEPDPSMNATQVIWEFFSAHPKR